MQNNPYTHYIENTIKHNDQFISDYGKIISESKHEFEKNEFELLLKSLPQRFFKSNAIERLRNLFDIKNNKFIEKYFIKKWYLHILEANPCPNEDAPDDQIFVIYGEIHREVIPKDFIIAYEEHESEPVYDENTITFIVFHLGLQFC